jgi:uncharacterized phage protein gp47/JayE
MPDLPSRLDLYALGRDYLVTRATRIDRNRVDVVGSDANLFVGSESVVAYSVVKQLGYQINSMLLDGAVGEDLDRYAYDRYKLPRKGAAGALGTVRFFRASSALGSGTIPIGTTVRSLTGSEYITVTAATFGPTTLDNVTADVRATQAGKATQVGANQLRSFSNPQALFDPTIQTNNDLATAGGEDVETDTDFRNRIRNFWLSARRGTLEAIVFGALTVPGVVSAVAIEAINGLSQPARIVNLYIADSSGVASVALGRLVSTALEEFRAGGITVLLNLSIPQPVQITLALTFVGGTDTVALSQSIQSAVVEFVNSLPANGPLYLIQLGAVLQRFASQGLVPNLSNIVAPVGDLVPALGQTFRITIQNVTIT